MQQQHQDKDHGESGQQREDRGQEGGTGTGEAAVCPAAGAAGKLAGLPGPRQAAGFDTREADP
jgi:hypothetical protein